METAAEFARATHRSATVRRLAVAALALVLAGCNGHRPSQVRGWVIADPASQHPIVVTNSEATLDLGVPRGAPGLTHGQAADARAFMRAYKVKGEGPLLVRAPSGGPNEVAAVRALEDVRALARQENVHAAAIRFEPYSSDGDPFAPVRLSYLQLVAQGPECGHWPQNLARDSRNLPYANQGCASQHNLAAMVSNPRDLIAPREETPRSSERRDAMWDKYVKGETTITKRDDKESAKVSEVEGGGQ